MACFTKEAVADLVNCQWISLGLISWQNNSPMITMTIMCAQGHVNMELYLSEMSVLVPLHMSATYKNRDVVLSTGVWLHDDCNDVWRCYSDCVYSWFYGVLLNSRLLLLGLKRDFQYMEWNMHDLVVIIFSVVCIHILPGSRILDEHGWN